MKGRSKVVVLVASLHAVAVFAVLVIGMSGPPVHGGSDAWGTVRIGWLRAAQLLMSPGGQLQRWINALMPSGQRVSDSLEWVIFFANSLLWGFAIAGLASWLARRLRTSRGSSPAASFGDR